MSRQPVTEQLPCEYCQSLVPAQQLHTHEVTGQGYFPTFIVNACVSSTGELLDESRKTRRQTTHYSSAERWKFCSEQIAEGSRSASIT